jgi:L-fuculose-phosphate aldolase
MEKIEEAIKIGKKLASYKLIDGASGNLSFRNGDLITITKKGVMLDELNEKSFITIKLGERNKEASSDLIVHEAIYKATDYKAILHCHGVFNVVLSLYSKEINPVDLEGRLFIWNTRVVEGEFGSKALAEAIAREIEKPGAVVVKAHGMYAAGATLDEAFRKATYLEHSCEILYRKEIMKK